MYIQPTTNIKLLKDAPLDATYDHTIYFNNTKEQYTYFSSLTKYNLTNYTYQRVKRGWARVGINSDKLYDCNYMMFQNTAYGDKWFYAFIKSVEFVNNECSEIEFEIDVMQTWHFNYDVDMCFVERQHEIRDNIGDNIVPETIDVGEYVYSSYKKIAPVLDALCVILVVSDDDIDSDGTVYGGVYGGATLFAYNLTDTDSIKNKINSYAQKPDAILAIYMCPTIAVEEVIETGGVKISFDKSCYKGDIELDKIDTTLTLDSYKPKNNKLYTYPFNFLEISSNGNSRVYRYEYFDRLTPTFELAVPLTMPIQVCLMPNHYKESNELELISESCLLTDYPMCSWNTDSFKAWLAQNSLPIGATTALAGTALVASAFGVGIPFLAGASIVHGVTSLMSQGYQNAIKADISKGSINSGSVDVASGHKNFYGGRMSVEYSTAKRIDDYFNMYGYAQKQCLVPNRNSRPHWNYVKTIGCTITGSVPSDDMRKICSIYDSGITFWKHGDEIGNYRLNNSPI